MPELPVLPQDTPPGNVSSRIAVLSDALLDLAFSYVSRSLFNSDRLTFGMHMARHLQPGMVKAEDWNFFLGAPQTLLGLTRPVWGRFSRACAGPMRGVGGAERVLG